MSKNNDKECYTKNWLLVSPKRFDVYLDTDFFCPKGSCFLRTDQLDGETDWKLRLPVACTQRLPTAAVSQSPMIHLFHIENAQFCCWEKYVSPLPGMSSSYNLIGGRLHKLLRLFIFFVLQKVTNDNIAQLFI